MTCIVGIEHAGRVYLGGDSAGVGGLSITLRADPKVFRAGDFVMGFTTSFRMGQLLHHTFDPPQPPTSDDDLERFMVRDFIPAVIACWEQGGWLSTSNGRHEGGTFLVGVRGCLFSVEEDLQVGRSLAGYEAVGCGSDLALGALHATREQKPRVRVRAALEAAQAHSAGVSGPFVYEKTHR